MRSTGKISTDAVSRLNSKPAPKPHLKPVSHKPAPVTRPVNAEAAAFLIIDEANAGQRIDNFLCLKLKGVPKSHVYRVIRSGEVRVNKGRVDASYKLAMDDVVRVPPVRLATVNENSNPSSGSAFEAKMAEKARQSLGILFEDDALIAVDKPAGLAVHGGSGVSFGVIEALRAQRPEAKYLELVHRLDRETSGILLVAKKRSALTAMHAMLRGDAGTSRMKKHYYALVKGDWTDEKRHIRSKLAKTETAGGEKRVYVDERDGQEAHTVVARVERFKIATLLDCDIRTGRTHQIRVHLSHLGFPIIGDDKYGDFALNKVAQAIKNGGLKRMFLHARLLELVHPVTGEKLTIQSPVPADLARYLTFLKYIKGST